jgi:hypothetical protein
VNPVEDALLFGLQLLDLFAYRFRTRIFRQLPLDPLNPPLPLKQQFHSYLETYRPNQRKVFDPYFKYFFRDPLVSVSWWLEFATWILGAGKQLGR